MAFTCILPGHRVMQQMILAVFHFPINLFSSALNCLRPRFGCFQLKLSLRKIFTQNSTFVIVSRNLFGIESFTSRSLKLFSSQKLFGPIFKSSLPVDTLNWHLRKALVLKIVKMRKTTCSKYFFSCQLSSPQCHVHQMQF